MTAQERFLKYITFATTSDEDRDTVPSTPGQLILGRYLEKELAEIGLENAEMDEFGYVYAWIPATPGRESDPVIALISHMDTAPRVPADQVKARLVACDGSDIVLNEEKGIVMRTEDFPDLEENIGKTLIMTDGTTLLGADDKAGVAEIVTAAEYLIQHPEMEHGRIAVCFTPDEEIGRGADHIDLKKLGADFGYTVDGGPLGTLEYENFNAAGAKVFIRGFNIHPGDAKNKMKNAGLIAAQFIQMVPEAETPAHTEGYEGFYHLCTIQADESTASMEWLIRDHSREKFEKRKQTMKRIAEYLNGVYGDGTVDLMIKDSYFNMREMVEPHPEILTRARQACTMAGIDCQDVPIRGGTDGAHLSFLGLPCPNLPTGGYHFHGVFEYIPAESLEKMVEVLINLLTWKDCH